MSVDPPGGFGIYVHWPFCAAKCPYCDFNSHVRHQPVDQPRYARALATELEHFAARTAGKRVGSIFFGGGTPSLMQPETVSQVLEAIARLWPIAESVEVTLEANPTSVDAAHFAGYRAAGVNRLSLGVQSLRDEALRKLGRLHSVAEAIDAIDLARRNFPRLSFDLIYARPGQTMAEWDLELREALALAADHLSLYQLTIEPGTPFYDLQRTGKLTVPGEEPARDLFDLTQQVCAEAGLPAYEISNHAQPGAASMHNLVYWRYGEYVGVGPGAHGRFVEGDVRRASVGVRAPEAWLTAVETDGVGTKQEEAISRADEGAEYLLMGLRLGEGIDPSRYTELTGSALAQDRVGELMDLGLLMLQENGRLAATGEGRAVLNRLVAELAS